MKPEKSGQGGKLLGGQHKKLHLGKEVAAVARGIGDAVFYCVYDQQKVQVMGFLRAVSGGAVEGEKAQVAAKPLGGDGGNC